MLIQSPRMMPNTRPRRSYAAIHRIFHNVFQIVSSILSTRVTPLSQVEITGRNCRSSTAISFFRMDTPIPVKLVYNEFVARTNININESLIRKAKKLTRLKTKREIVDRALELLVRSEDRKSILHYHGSGIWKGNYKLARRNRV